MSETIPIVNNGDVVVSHKLRDALQPEDTYRIVGLWAMSENGSILLSQRRADKDQEAGKWDTAVAGTVQGTETYEAAIVREIQEELGLDLVGLKKRIKLFIQGSPSHFCQTFTATVPQQTEITVNEQEITQVAWFAPDILEAKLAEHPDDFTPGVAWGFEHLR